LFRATFDRKRNVRSKIRGGPDAQQEEKKKKEERKVSQPVSLATNSAVGQRTTMARKGSGRGCQEGGRKGLVNFAVRCTLKNSKREGR